MKLKKYFEQLETQTGINKWMWMMLSSLIVAVVMLSVKVAFTTDKIRTILTPPDIKKTMWVDDAGVSKEYLDQMAVFFAQLMYNTTPANGEAQHNELLKYVSPELYSSLDGELKLSDRTMKQLNVATWMVPVYVGSDEKTKTTIIEGEFFVTQGKEVTQRSMRKLEIKFAYAGGRISIIAFKDTSKNNLNQAAVIDPNAPEVDPKTGKQVDEGKTLVPVNGNEKTTEESNTPKPPPQPQLGETVQENSK
jgi:conjugal transfer pilus assembly protein TraE